MVYGGFNHIQNSSWSVLVYLKDGRNGDTDSVEGIGSGSPLRVEGKLFDEQPFKYFQQFIRFIIEMEKR